jgi:hypothetical protein
MNPKCSARCSILITIALLGLFLVGCSGESGLGSGDLNIIGWAEQLFSKNSSQQSSSSRSYQTGTYPIDPLFADFYKILGGEDVLGPAISPTSNVGGKTSQYVEAGLLVFDPREPESSRFHLAPLGNDLRVHEEADHPMGDGKGRIINGHLVIAEIFDVYESLGGARFVGKPITGAKYNDAKGRVEQYFENLGFYKLDKEKKIRLMPYGVYSCDRKCRYQEPQAWIPGREPILPEPFLEKTLQLGLPFVGRPLTGLHIAPDGQQEVIFENLVLAADLASPDEVQARSLGAEIGYQIQNLVLPNESPLMIFFEISDGKGHNVPTLFIDYLNLYGGLEVAGNPISEVFSTGNGTYRQCFTNLCLDFEINSDDDQNLKPAALGEKYKTEYYDKIRDFESNQTMENLDLKVWEENIFVSSDTPQEIYVALYENGKPLENCEPILIVTMLDGSKRRSTFQPSNENGQTSIRLSPIEAPNGTLIAYQICIMDLNGTLRCVGDNYLIWNSD